MLQLFTLHDNDYSALASDSEASPSFSQWDSRSPGLCRLGQWSELYHEDLREDSRSRDYEPSPRLLFTHQRKDAQVIWFHSHHMPVPRGERASHATVPQVSRLPTSIVWCYSRQKVSAGHGNCWIRGFATAWRMPLPRIYYCLECCHMEVISHVHAWYKRHWLEPIALYVV